MRELVTSERVCDYLRECLDGDHGPRVFFRALDFCADRAFGKVPQVTRVATDDTGKVLIVRSAADALADFDDGAR